MQSANNKIKRKQHKQPLSKSGKKKMKCLKYYDRNKNESCIKSINKGYERIFISDVMNFSIFSNRCDKHQNDDLLYMNSNE